MHIKVDVINTAYKKVRQENREGTHISWQQSGEYNEFFIHFKLLSTFKNVKAHT